MRGLRAKPCCRILPARFQIYLTWSIVPLIDGDTDPPPVREPLASLVN